MTRRGMVRTLLLFLAGCSVSLSAKSKYRLRVLSYRCVGCRDCYRVCPKPDAIVMRRGKAVINQEACICCMRCESVCTYGALERCEEYER